MGRSHRFGGLHFTDVSSKDGEDKRFVIKLYYEVSPHFYKNR